MSIFRDPIFKSIMFALAVGYIALGSQSAWAAKGGKPPPEPQPSQVVLVDADGKMIGDAFQSVEIGTATIYFQDGDNIYTTGYYDTDFDGYSFTYDGIDCSGNAYVHRDVRMGMEYLSFQSDNILYKAAETPESVVTIYSSGRTQNGVMVCFNYNTPLVMYDKAYKPIPAVDLSVFRKPYRVKLIPAK